ncbi:MAG: DNA repair protein RadC [Lachnospiraceae bacterium]|nr:DNA repair protein RadC [Lachnospiraceae bacterium]MBP5254880.1 DNA repair protein RadC [Lachnospiraceae bacterium]
MRSRIKELPPELQPCEKAMRYGIDALDDTELLAVLLRSGVPGENVRSVAGRIMNAAGGRLGGLNALSEADLLAVPGIGKVKMLQIRAMLALSRRISASMRADRTDFSSARLVAEHFMEELCAEQQEVLKALYLNTKCRLLREVSVTRGSVNHTIVPVREILIGALQAGAVYIILVHNHPSGDPEPSEQDVAATKRVSEAGKLVGIFLQDHIVIGDHCYVSMRDRGLVE